MAKKNTIVEEYYVFTSFTYNAKAHKVKDGIIICTGKPTSKHPSNNVPSYRKCKKCEEVQ